MIWRPALPADRPEIERRLGARPERAMFPLSNLRSFGLSENSDDRRAMRFWLSERGVFGLSREGMAMPVLDAPEVAETIPPLIGGETVMGALGPTAEARAFLRACRLDASDATMDADEPQFLLALDDLRMPQAEGLALRSMAEEDLPLLAEWRFAFGTEVMGWDEGHRGKAAADAVRHLEGGAHRIVMRDGAPVAVTGFNAVLPEIVQVGGVFVPPALRGGGLARAAVALHLAEAGVPRATLCAASDHAARAYMAIGFERCGDFTMCLLREPREVPA